ncbi:hypothetical protein FRC11_001120 [Ceratobasidium sp. 423]|nr:hypothetical protein FRC11_001120 [Ceratobasidium sp. 423]
MDIIFRVHQHQLDENDLERIDEDLRGFHNNKEIFHLLGAFTSRSSWNGIPKLHVAMHWTLQIHEYGSADNYDTEIPECLHWHYVKNPYHQCTAGELGQIKVAAGACGFGEEHQVLNNKSPGR